MARKPRLALIKSSKANPTRTPSTLGKSGSKLWSSIQDEYRIDDAGGLALLHQVCLSIDRADECADASEFETPIPMITREGAKPFPPTGYRTLDARSMFFYGITGITPAMSMRLTGIGSQYLFATVDANKQYFDGAKTYKVTLPKGIPEEKFWSFTVYDNQTRSMLDTPQRYPRAGSQSYPSPAAEPDADGSTTVYFGPTQPAGVKRGNWIQTTPGKGWFTILRLYSPLEPFFTKAWRPSEIALVR